MAEFKNYFENWCNPNDDNYQPINNIEEMTEDLIRQDIQYMFEELNVPIRNEEIIKSISQLKK